MRTNLLLIVTGLGTAAFAGYAMIKHLTSGSTPRRVRASDSHSDAGGLWSGDAGSGHGATSCSDSGGSSCGDGGGGGGDGGGGGGGG